MLNIQQKIRKGIRMRLKIISAAIVFLSCLFLASCGKADACSGPLLEDVGNCETLPCITKKDERPGKSCLIFVLNPTPSGAWDLSDCYFYRKDRCRENLFHLYDGADLHVRCRFIGKVLPQILQKAFPSARLTEGAAVSDSDTLFIVVPFLTPADSNRYTIYNIFPSVPAALHDLPVR